MDKINVLIADDHTLFRKGVRKMLEAEEGMRVVGEAATGREALEQVRAMMPDVILMDIKMPDPSAGSGQALDGVEATRTLCREMPHVGIIFVTMFQDDEFVFKGCRRVAGATSSRTLKVAMTMINGRKCEVGARVKPDDRVILIPQDVAALWRAFGRMNMVNSGTRSWTLGKPAASVRPRSIHSQCITSKRPQPKRHLVGTSSASSCGATVPRSTETQGFYAGFAQLSPSSSSFASVGTPSTVQPRFS